MNSRLDTHALDLKIPPVGLVMAFAVLMWLGPVCFPGLNFQIPFQPMIALAFGLSGVVICALGLFAFRRAKTTINPTKPHAASSLVRLGIYCRTRNPMYLGFLLILAGWAAFNANFLAIVLLPAFVLYMNRFQIMPEERALASIFGDDFKAYCAVVRRWI